MNERDPKVPLMGDGAGTPSPRITCVLTRDAVHGLPGVRGRGERACALFRLTVALTIGHRSGLMPERGLAGSTIVDALAPVTRAAAPGVSL
jgi:hypothetical protein